MGELISRVWKDPVWSAVIAGAILSSCAMIMRLFQSGPIPPIKLDFLSHNFPPWSLIAAGTFICVLGMVPLIEGIASLGKKVSWNFDGYLGMTGNGLNIRIMSFQFSGVNIQDRPIERISGYIRSLVTNEKFPLFLNPNGTPVATDRLQAIPPGSSFRLVVPFKRDVTGFDKWQGLPPETFMADNAEFELALSVDDREELFRFRRSDNSRSIQRFVQSMPQESPRLILKE